MQPHLMLSNKKYCASRFGIIYLSLIVFETQTKLSSGTYASH